MNNILWW